jgi:hypothetical protein
MLVVNLRCLVRLKKGDSSIDAFVSDGLSWAMYVASLWVYA